MKTQKHILPIIVFSQFCCTSLWFAGNAVISDLSQNFNLSESALGQLTSAVQFGFIIGTFLFALLTISDRFSASRVFFFSAILAGIFNSFSLYSGNSIISLVAIRFATGFFLAGIYPVGMKIASDYFEKGLGKSLSYLVGALVLGTDFPHVLKAELVTFNWKTIIITTSCLSILGGLLILIFVPNGPFYKKALQFDSRKIVTVFKNPKFKSAAFGYFGHMWELYTFWAFVPFLLKTYLSIHITKSFNIPLFSFLIIALGSLGCIIGGNLASKYNTKTIAKVALTISGVCCLLSPLFFYINSEIIFLLFLMIWGMAVIADSPLFSTLVAQNANADSKGTALTIVNCIGYTITIFSILLFNELSKYITPTYLFAVLVLGPIFGLFHLRKRS